MAFQDRLRECLRGWATQREFAEAVGVSPSAVTGWLSRARGPADRLWPRIERVTGRPRWWFYLEEGEEPARERALDRLQRVLNRNLEELAEISEALVPEGDDGAEGPVRNPGLREFLQQGQEPLPDWELSVLRQLAEAGRRPGSQCGQVRKWGAKEWELFLEQLRHGVATVEMFRGAK